jgi:hypothetical protein
MASGAEPRRSDLQILLASLIITGLLGQRLRTCCRPRLLTNLFERGVAWKSLRKSRRRRENLGY